MDKLIIKIRPMSKADIDGIMSIEEATYGEHHWSRDSFYSELSNNLARYFCAFNENDELLGYAGSWLIVDEAHITNSAVNPNDRGKKIG